MELTSEEGRVLGCLVEKQLPTPQQYPLTENALLLERGAIVHRARSADLLKDDATPDRYIGLRVTEGKPIKPSA